MKKFYLLAGLILSSAIVLSQSKEIKKAERAIAKNDMKTAISLLNQAETLLGSADTDDKVRFYLAKSSAYLAEAGSADFNKMKTAAESYLKAVEIAPKGKFEKEFSTGRQNLRVALVNSAIEDQKIKNYARAAEKLHLSYKANPQDTSDLYYAAGNAVNGKDYDTALDYYKQLLDIGYTGIEKEYTLYNTETNKTEVFYSADERKSAQLIGKDKYIKPGERLSESVQGDILQKVTLIYISQGKNDEARELMDAARKANPSDVTLMRSDADLAYKMGDMKRYDMLMNEIIKTDPNNPEIYYNLGVSAASNGQNDKAMEYYEKAIELKPDYAVAHINIAALLLGSEEEIVNEMNSLGNSTADNKRYDELKEKRQNLYSEALPHLEIAVKERNTNVELVRTIMNIYSQLGMDDKFKVMKEKLDALEGGGK